MSLYRSGVFMVKGMREFTKSAYERAKNAFTDEEMSVACENRVFLVTGANSGIGRAAAAEFVRRAGTVHILCRNEQKCAEAAATFRELNTKVTVFEHIVDMSNSQDVYDFTQRFNKVFGKLDVLINNAGVLLNERTETAHHLETSFATNVLGTYICTIGLLPSLRKSSDPRVIMVSSGGAYSQKLDLTDLQSEKGWYFDGTTAYAHQKRLLIIMTEQFALKYPEITFVTMHPGWVDTPGVQTSLPIFHKLTYTLLRTPEEGVDTIVWLATIPKTHSSIKNGAFYFDRQETAKHLPLAWTRSAPEEDAQLMSVLADYALRTCDIGIADKSLL